MTRSLLPRRPVSGYTVDDLDWLRDEIGVAHLELDPWGSLIVSPADDEHEGAAATLARQAIEQLPYPVSVNGYGWTVPGGSGYLMVPDLMVLATGWKRVAELHFDPPPLLAVEIASPTTRRADRTRKPADYRLGGARVYLLVDLPSTFERHDFSTGEVVTVEGTIDLVVGDQPVRFELP
ncbi:MAG: Uma2 family endonuclease [Actinomycetota bacterium]|nr:Uma2 family endonuclease [Actinomycetota bacterium]